MDFSSCGVRAPHGGGLPSCPADSRACGLQQLWGAGSVPAGCRLWRVGSVAVAPGLSCTEVCGISPDQGLNPRPHINRRILIPCATREVQGRFFSASGETIHSQAVRPPNQNGRGPSACGRPILLPCGGQALWARDLETESESEVAQSCPTLCDPIDLPGSSVHGIFQAIVLEWVAISFSRGSSQPRAQTQVAHIVDRRFTV